MQAINLPTTFRWTNKTMKDSTTEYLGGFVSVNGFPLFMGEKESGDGPKHVLLPAGKNPETGDLYISYSYPAMPDKAQGKLERTLELF